MKVHVSDVIRITVNGKIDGIRTDLNTYIKEDLQWKERAQPAIDIVTNVQGFGKVALYVFGFIAAAGAAWALVAKNILKL